MTQTAINNAVVLYMLGLPRVSIEEAEKVFCATPYLKKVLSNPVIKKEEKHKVLDDIFSGELKNYFKLLCDEGRINILDDIFKAYYKYWDKKNNILRVYTEYADSFTDKDKEEIISFLKDKYPGMEIILTAEKNPELIGGFVIHAGNDLYDKSYDGMLRQLEMKLCI